MYTQASPIHAQFAARNFQPMELGRDYEMDDAADVMKAVGIGFNKRDLRDMASFYAMDSIQNPILAPSIDVPIQFLQDFLPGIVNTVTAAQEIDNIIGVTTAANWGDQEVIQQVLENTGAPVPYGDNSVVPLANWNLGFVARDIVRFELGLKVGPLEEYRASKVRVDSAGQKRTSVALNLEIQRNQLGFYGYNNGLNKTYGFLNDPNLPNYNTVANPGSGTSWAGKTFLQIQADILTGLQTLRTQSKGVIKPNQTPITMAIATNSVDYLAKTSDFGISVYDWLKQFYPNVRIADAPQLNGANGGANVFYLFADYVNDGASSDDRRTFIQIVPAKFQLLGVAKLSKGFEESYSNASAGALLKRPYAVWRGSGI